MVKKIKKYLKFVVCCALIMSLVAPSYAALSASDGSAFVTKAEFDSALADFNARLTTFEAGINSKIDSQVTSYLDRNGIWNGKEITFINNKKIGHGTYKNVWGVGIDALKCGSSQSYTNRTFETITQADLDNPPSPLVGAFDSWKGKNYWRYVNNTKSNGRTYKDMRPYMPECRQEWYAEHGSIYENPVLVEEIQLGDSQLISQNLPKSGMLFMQSIFGNCQDAKGRWGVMFGISDYTDAAGKNNDPGWTAQLNMSYPSFSINTYVCEVKAGEALPTTFTDWQHHILASIPAVTVQTWPMLSKNLNFPYYIDPATEELDPAIDSLDKYWFLDNPDVVGIWQVSMNTGLGTNTFFVSKNSDLYFVSTLGYAFKFQYNAEIIQTMAHHVQNYVTNEEPILICSGGVY